jgi:ribonuclease BN (tRNA processing enzyme)
MNVLILGVGDAFTARHFGSSALIQGPEGPILIDCPDLIHRVLRVGSALSGWTIDAFGVDDIILTHLHGDHCNGLESFAFARWFHRRENPERPLPRLHCAQPVADRLWERLAPAMDGTHANPDQPRRLEDFFDVRVLDPGSDAQIAGLKVRCRFTLHPVPTIGLKVSDGRHTFGWSGDTPFDPDHVAWLENADLIVHECNRGAAHTPIDDLNALPPRMRKKVRLIHLPDDFDPRCTDIEILEEGQVLEIGRKP